MAWADRILISTYRICIIYY